MNIEQFDALKKDLAGNESRHLGIAFWEGYLYGLLDFGVVTEVQYLHLKDVLYETFIQGGNNA